MARLARRLIRRVTVASVAVESAAALVVNAVPQQMMRGHDELTFSGKRLILLRLTRKHILWGDRTIGRDTKTEPNIKRAVPSFAVSSIEASVGHIAVRPGRLSARIRERHGRA
jgi:hypothetical protein